MSKRQIAKVVLASTALVAAGAAAVAIKSGNLKVYAPKRVAKEINRDQRRRKARRRALAR